MSDTSLTGGSHLHCILLSGHLLILGYSPVHFTVCLNKIEIVPLLFWVRDFLFVLVFSRLSPFWAYDLSLHLIMWAGSSLWGLTIKVESSGNAMPPTDNDWWRWCFLTNCTPHNKSNTWEMLIEMLCLQRYAFLAEINRQKNCTRTNQHSSTHQFLCFSCPSISGRFKLQV